MNVIQQRIAAVILSISLAVALPAAAAAQARPAPPPEYKPIVAAYNIPDAAARLKEFERLKMAYPNSQYMEAIEASILVAKVELAATLEAVLALQKEAIAKGQGPARLQNPVVMAIQLLKHARLGTFDKARVLETILAYKGAAATS
jgi:hypothetical protein